MSVEGTNTAAPSQSTGPQSMPSLADVQGEFFGGPSPAPSPAPIENQVLPGQNEEAPQQKEKPSLDQWERITAEERENYRNKKKFSDERETFEKERDDFYKKREDADRFYNDMEDPQDPNQQDDGTEDLTYEQMRDQIRKDIMGELQGERTKEREEQEVQSSVDSFQTEIDGYIEKNSNIYPLIAGMNNQNAVFNAIEEQYQQDANDYGHERAAEMMLSQEQASQKVEQHLATEIKGVLQSEGMRDFLLREINLIRSNGNNQEQSQKGHQSQGPATLNNSTFNQATESINEASLTDEEAFNRALSMVH